MPVEIRELTVKVTVGQGAPPGGGGQVATSGGKGGGADIDLIVEKVLQALAQKQER